MYHCSKKLVNYKEYSCFKHSDFPAHSVFTFDACWGSPWVVVSLGTQVQLRIILDPDYFPDDFPVSYDYDWNKGLQPYRNNIENQSTILWLHSDQAFTQFQLIFHFQLMWEVFLKFKRRQVLQKCSRTENSAAKPSVCV